MTIPQIDEMIGICKGIIAGNKINHNKINRQEADFLSQWLESNKRTANSWPANILYQRIDKILKYNTLDRGEKANLLGTLHLIGCNDNQYQAEPRPLDSCQRKLLTACMLAALLDNARDGLSPNFNEFQQYRKNRRKGTPPDQKALLGEKCDR